MVGETIAEEDGVRIENKKASLEEPWNPRESGRRRPRVVFFWRTLADSGHFVVLRIVKIECLEWIVNLERSAKKGTLLGLRKKRSIARRCPRLLRRRMVLFGLLRWNTICEEK